MELHCLTRSPEEHQKSLPGNPRQPRNPPRILPIYLPPSWVSAISTWERGSLLQRYGGWWLTRNPVNSPITQLIWYHRCVVVPLKHLCNCSCAIEPKKGIPVFKPSAYLLILHDATVGFFEVLVPSTENSQLSHHWNLQAGDKLKAMKSLLNSNDTVPSLGWVSEWMKGATKYWTTPHWESG